MRFNVFPGPVCRHSTSPSLDFLRPALSAGLLRSLSLFRFFPLSAFLSTSSSFSPPYLRLSFTILVLSLSSVMFPQLFQPPPPEAIPFPPAAFLLTLLLPCSNDVSRRLSLFFRVWQPFVPHPSSHPPVLLSLGTCPIPATNFDYKVSTI